MANRIVSVKDFRADFRKEVLSICDFSNKKNKNVLGSSSKQMTIEVAVSVIDALKAKFQSEGKSLDKDMIELHTPRGARRYASEQLNQMAKVSLVRGANEIETLWRTFGDLIVVGRKGRGNVYVAKNGATDMEFTSVIELRTGKLNARIKTNEELTNEISRCKRALVGRHLGEAYAETCTEYFQSLEAA